MEQQIVHEHHFGEICARETHAAENAHADLLPDDRPEIGKLDLAERETADDGDGRLRAAVAARAGEHRDERREHKACRELVLEMVDDEPCERGREHEDEKPRDTRFPCFEHARIEIRPLRGRHTGHLFNVLGGLFFHNVDGVVYGDDADEPVFGVHDREGVEVVFGEHLRDGLLVLGRRDGNDVRLHDVLDHVVIVREDERAQRERADEPALVDHIAGVDRFLIDAGALDALGRLLHGHLRAEGDELRCHDAAGAVLGIAQDLVDHPAHVGVGLPENALYDVRGHLLDEIDRVVHIQLVHDLFELGVRKAADEQLLLLGLHFDECFRRQLLRQQPKKERQGKLVCFFKNRRHVRRVHRYENVPERGVFLPLDQRGERAFESDGSLCHWVLPPWIFMGS